MWCWILKQEQHFRALLNRDNLGCHSNGARWPHIVWDWVSGIARSLLRTPDVACCGWHRGLEQTKSSFSLLLINSSTRKHTLAHFPHPLQLLSSLLWHSSLCFPSPPRPPAVIGCYLTHLDQRESGRRASAGDPVLRSLSELASIEPVAEIPALGACTCVVKNPAGTGELLMVHLKNQSDSSLSVQRQKRGDSGGFIRYSMFPMVVKGISQKPDGKRILQVFVYSTLEPLKICCWRYDAHPSTFQPEEPISQSSCIFSLLSN